MVTYHTTSYTWGTEGETMITTEDEAFREAIPLPYDFFQQIFQRTTCKQE